MALSVPLYLACGLNSNDTSSERPPGTTQRQTWTFLAIPISISICGWQYGDNQISLDVNHVLLIGTMTTASTWPTTQVQQPMQEQMNHWVLSYFWGRNSRALEQLLTLGQISVFFFNPKDVECGPEGPTFYCTRHSQGASSSLVLSPLMSPGRWVRSHHSHLAISHREGTEQLCLRHAFLPFLWDCWVNVILAWFFYITNPETAV